MSFILAAVLVGFGTGTTQPLDSDYALPDYVVPLEQLLEEVQLQHELEHELDHEHEPEPEPHDHAHAHDSVWDLLAQCESNGDWHINTGNGYSGGLQWNPDTWRSAGGTQYAPTAWQATREQEIAVAEEWLAKTSWAQWPACSKKLGLR